MLLEEQSHFLYMKPRLSAKNHCLTEGLAARMSNAWGTRGVVLTLCAGLLIDAGAFVPSSSEVVTDVSSSLTEHVGPAPVLVVAERNHGRTYTKLV